MLNLSCTRELPEVDGLKSDEMSVGRHLILKCKGEIPENFNIQSAVLKDLSGSTFPWYRLFKIEQQGQNEIILDLTLYKTGEQDLTSLVLSDGVHELTFAAEKLNVISVIEKTSDGKPPQPFPAIVPLRLEIPPLYLVLAGAVLLSLILAVIYNIKRRAEIRAIKARLQQYDTPLDPETEFYRALRRAEKNDYAVHELERAFKLYNLRLYRVPFFDLNDAEALKFFKRERPELGRRGLEMARFINELSDILKRQNEISTDEKKHLVKKMYRYVDQHRGEP